MIATYNRALTTRICVDCLRTTKTPLDQYEIIIVDDNSAEGERGLLHETYGECGNITILHTTRKHDRRLCPAYPKNVGIRHAQYQNIACCDSDILHFTDPITRTISWLGRHPKRYVVSGLWGQVDGPPAKPTLKFWKRRAMPFGAWIAMRREHWFDLRGFDERFVDGGGEDADLARRLTMRRMLSLADTRIIAFEVKGESSTRASHSQEQWKALRNDKSMRRNLWKGWGQL